MRGRAIVIGASMAGLSAARVLSDHADEVVVLERDELRDDARPRRGVPQGRHAHAILAAGEQLIAGWYPGIVDELVERGAVRADGGDALWWQAGAFKVQAETGITATSVSRPLLEQTVRQRLEALPNVRIRTGRSVEALALAPGRVTGVVVDGETLAADLVVDCSGRTSRLPTTLAAAGYDVAPVSQVRIDMSYGTRILRRVPGDLGAAFSIVAPTPPTEPRFGVLLPIEHDRWILTVGGFHGDAAPTDDEGYAAYVRSLPTPVIADLYDGAEKLSDVMTHRLASNQRRHVEKLKKVPAGFVVLGDGVCSFNPIYGQGMSSAAQQADALDRAITRIGLADARLPRAFYKAAAKVVANPWQIAAGSDFLHPATTGPKPPGTDLINRYVGKVQLATHTSPEVLRQMVRVQNLLDPPPSLMKPAMVRKVRAAARRSPAVTGGRVAPPTALPDDPPVAAPGSAHAPDVPASPARLAG
ncbi:MAG: FAD-dependent monooxygenase [Acidimicrobiales bacterium]